MVAPNIKIVQEYCTATSDYFTLYEREIPMDFSKSIEKPDISQIKGEIIFKDVEFIYPSDVNKRLILDNIKLTFESGKKVALFGELGCGKKTNVNLIERLYEATDGEILINNIEIKRYDIQYLRSLIGYANQNQFYLINQLEKIEELLKSLGNIDTLIEKHVKNLMLLNF